MIVSPARGGACAECSTTTVAVGDATPWCPRCEWRLDLYEPARHRPEFGWRWVICLGLPLWGALAPQERVALLGHELGHFVNGDVRRTLLTQPAFTMLGTAADLVRPVEATHSGVGVLGALLAEVVQRVAARLLFAGHVLLVWLGQRDAQRAEYLADELAAKVGGSAAAASGLDAMLLQDAVEMVVRREARAGHGPERWRRAADEARESAGPTLPALQQLSVRDEVSLFASHPPSGLRSRMIRERQWHTPAVVLTQARLQRIDGELARHYERITRDISWGG